MLFDAVLFDLDGTLVATDRFWGPAARTGCRRAFRELGLDREPPSSEAWMDMVGLPFDQGLRQVLPELDAASLAVVGRHCLAEEERRLQAGGAAPMPGALELLGGLAQAGVAVGVASNCSGAYLEHMLGPGLGLGPLVREARCLDSPGVRHKADMIRDLLAVFGTRRAVFVGDRETDREAAWENGLPHVHCRFGFASADEEGGAQAVIEDLGQLASVLERRRSWIEEALERAGVLRSLDAGPAPVAVGITGPPCVGKTLFARDAAEVASAHGLSALAVDLEAYRRPGAPTVADDPLAAYDLEALERDCLRPGAKEGLDLVFLEGEGLLDPRLAPRLARTIYLEAPEDLLLRRAAARIAPGEDPGPLVALHRGALPLHRAWVQRYPPGEHADLVLDASNPLGLDPGAPGD